MHISGLSISRYPGPAPILPQEVMGRERKFGSSSFSKYENPIDTSPGSGDALFPKVMHSAV